MLGAATATAAVLAAAADMLGPAAAAASPAAAAAGSALLLQLSLKPTSEVVSLQRYPKSTIIPVGST